MSKDEKPEKPTNETTRPIDGGSSYVTLNDPLKNKENRNK